MIPRRKKTPVREVPYTRLQNDSELTKLYVFERKLGRGNYGVVYRATHTETQTPWAIKEIHKPEPGHPHWKLLDNEIGILQRLDHPNIIHLREVLNTAQKMYLSLELCTGGDLKHLLKKKRFLTEDEARPIIRDLAHVVIYLHRRDIAHRDLKLENILLKNPVDDDSPIIIKVADFGLALQSDSSGAGFGTLMTQVCGTHTYMAPEVMSGAGYSHSCDLWSIGVIMYMLLCGFAPFEAKSKTKRLDKMRKGVTFPHPVWACVSETAQTVLSHLLTSDPAHRMTAYQLLESTWITGDFSRPVRPTNIHELMSQWRREHAGVSVSAESSPRVDSSSSASDSPRPSQNKLDNGVSQKQLNEHKPLPPPPSSSSSVLLSVACRGQQTLKAKAQKEEEQGPQSCPGSELRPQHEQKPAAVPKCA
ncbi:serine/threonine-protein kinase 33 [Boleophthalmus pectinirostris]|uniref:serine/threonine-protein kinase 33 n=1 Tax=Boleophthalmus pectinirostris TaxID=150288 RepID=UPI00243198B5|nr:serine/threonine-protein kinase 33 [Boleophthalmus pectinirostris]